jgi:hypothetical protein
MPTGPLQILFSKKYRDSCYIDESWDPDRNPRCRVDIAVVNSTVGSNSPLSVNFLSLLPEHVALHIRSFIRAEIDSPAASRTQLTDTKIPPALPVRCRHEPARAAGC